MVWVVPDRAVHSSNSAYVAPTSQMPLMTPSDHVITKTAPTNFQNVLGAVQFPSGTIVGAARPS